MLRMASKLKSDVVKERYIKEHTSRIKRLKKMRKEGIIPVADNKCFFDKDQQRWLEE